MKYIGAILAALALAFAVSHWVVRDFTQPIAGNGDHNIWEYQGYFFARNVDLLPFPSLELENDDNGFPFRVQQALSQSWAFEQHLWYAAFYSAFGPGPWLQPYFMLSLLVTAGGAFLLLRKDFGFGRSALAGIALGFFNYYAYFKYPEHYTFAVAHWVVLGMLCDFIIVRRLVGREPITPRLLVGRMMLLLLSLGLDLGYTFGYGLMVACIAGAWCGFLMLQRNQWRIQAALRNGVGWWRSVRNQGTRGQKALLVLMLAITAAAGFIFVPLAAQIALASRSFDFSSMELYGSWVNPLRLLIPYLPGIDSGGSPLWSGWLRDAPETPADARPGLALVLLAVLSLAHARKAWRIWLPFVAALVLCLFYHPRYFPTLKVFPWFEFNRGAGRASVIYPALLCILCLLPVVRTRFGLLRGGPAAALAVLAFLEFAVVCGMKSKVNTYSFAPSFGPTMEAIRAGRGSALFEWPFSISSGNGVGFAEGFSPYYQFGFNHTLARFHGKKTMGYYLARMHPDQLKPFADVGWDLLFLPDKPSPWQAKRQARDFREDEWDFLMRYYRAHDFCGALVYVDFVPPEVLVRFRAAFGPELAATTVPVSGRVVYFEGGAAGGTLADAGGKLTFASDLSPAGVDLVREMMPAGIRGLSGIGAAMGDIETDGNGTTFRWTNGPAAALQLHAAESADWVLEGEWDTPFSGQTLTLHVNGTEVASASAATNGTLKISARVALKAGWNECRLTFGTWNQKDFADRIRWKLLRRKGATVAFPGDSRPLAARCLKFVLLGSVRPATAGIGMGENSALQP